MRVLLGVLALGCGPTFALPETVGDDDMDQQVDAGPTTPPPTYPDAASYGPGADAGVCAEVEVHFDQVIPTVVLLVDRSGTMQYSFPGASNRWEAVYQTLMNPSSGIVANLQGAVRFGLTLYTSFDGFATGTCPRLHVVPPALDNFGAIDAVYGPIGLGEDTPTGAAVQAVIPSLQAYPEPGPKIIVLATDGMPDTCTNPDPDGQQGAKDASIQAVQAAFSAGIETYVISVGPDVALDHLQHVANAGRGMPPSGSGGNMPYYRALDTPTVAEAFEDIINGVRSCTFTLNGSVSPSAENDGHVYLDGIEVPPDEWDLADESTLELTGAACNILLEGGDHDVSATFPCDGIVLD